MPLRLALRSELVDRPRLLVFVRVGFALDLDLALDFGSHRRLALLRIKGPTLVFHDRADVLPVAVQLLLDPIVDDVPAVLLDGGGEVGLEEVGQELVIHADGAGVLEVFVQVEAAGGGGEEEFGREGADDFL